MLKLFSHCCPSQEDSHPMQVAGTNTHASGILAALSAVKVPATPFFFQYWRNSMSSILSSAMLLADLRKHSLPPL